MLRQSGSSRRSFDEDDIFDAYGGKSSEESRFSLDPVRLFWMVFSYRWLLLSLLVLGVLLAVIQTSLQTPIYRASIKVSIQTAGAVSVSEFEVLGESRASAFSAIQDAATRIRTRNLARRVVYALNLSERPDFYAPESAGASGGLFGSGESADQPIPDAAMRERRAIGLVLAGLSVNTARQSTIITVSFQHPSRALTHLVINQVGRSFIEMGVDQTIEASSEIREFITEQVEVSKAQLTASERQLNEYARTINFTEVGDEPSLLASSMTSVNTALNEVIQERLGIELVVAQIQAGKAISLPEVIGSRTIQTIKSRIAELNIEYREKSDIYKPDFPEMVQIRSQVSELESQLVAEIGIISESFLLQLDQLGLKEKSLNDELQRLAEAQRSFRENFVEYAILQREVESNRSQYAALIVKLNEVGIGSEIRRENAVIVEEAEQPRAPFSPKLRMALAIWIMISLLLFAIAVYVMEMIKNSFTSPEQLKSHLGIDALGIIPYVETADDPFYTGSDTLAFEESYRSLRTAIEFAGLNAENKTIVVTSSEPSEGKSITSFKIAEGFAALNYKVLLVDADIRRPRQHKWFGIGNTLGFCSLLARTVSDEDIPDLFKPTDVPNLTFMPAGGTISNAADLLASNEAANLIHSFSKGYDLVVLDSPPVMGLADAPILARYASATLFVVSARQVTRKAASVALSRLTTGGANVIGVVMTKFVHDKYNYSYNYSYSNHDDSGYLTPTAQDSTT